MAGKSIFSMFFFVFSVFTIHYTRIVVSVRVVNELFGFEIFLVDENVVNGSHDHEDQGQCEDRGNDDHSCVNEPRVIISQVSNALERKIR